MKAKLPEAERVYASGTKYLCIWCDAEFYKLGKTLACPSCSNSDVKDIVPIYLEDDPQEEALYCKVDFTGG